MPNRFQASARDDIAPPQRPGHRLRSRTLALALAWFAVAGCTPSPRHPTEPNRPRISGAYRALSFWGESRAYPAGDLSSDAYSRGHERARATLRRPLAQAFGRSQALSGGQGAGWQPIGPTNGGGRTLSLAFEPGNPGTIYSGAASGGLWRSTTGGVGPAAWERIHTGFPELGVAAIEFEPGNADVIYLGTGEVYNEAQTGDLAADRRTRGSYGIGILKSEDGGQTWTRALDWSYNQRHGVWEVRVDPLDTDIVWAATTDGVYKSLDAGQTWTRKLAVPMAMDLVLHPVTPDVALVGCGNLSSAGRGLYRTVDGGDTWSPIAGGAVPADFAGKIQLGVTPADPDVVYASIGNGFEILGPDNFTWLLRSDDFGATWSLRNTTDYSQWQGWYAHDVAVSPTDPDTIVAVGIDAWRSTTGGSNLLQVTSWQNYFTGLIPPGGPEGTSDYSHADHHAVAFHPTDPNVLYLATDGGVFRSTDGGLTFAGANGGLQTQQFYNGFFSHPTDPDLAMGGLQDFGSAIYRGNGQWQRWVLGGDGGWAAIDPFDPDVVYATYQFNNAGKSTNGGFGFSPISPPSLGGPVAFISPFLQTRSLDPKLYAASSYLFVSFDGGGMWFVGQGGTPIDGNPVLVMAVADGDEDVLYLATAPIAGRGRVHVTMNGGGSFTDITGSLPDRYPGDMIVDPTDDATVYLTMSGFGSSHVFRSTDSGAQWTDMDQGRLPDVPTTAVAVDPMYPNHVYVGNDLGVFFTADGGANWVQLDLGLPEAVLVGDLSVSPANRRLRVATHGQGVFERSLLGGEAAGAVPDGDDVAGTPLTILRQPDGDLALSWAASCAGDDDYAIYEGALGDFDSHAPVTCSTGGATTGTLTAAPGDRYYLVVPRNLVSEGSYGRNSANVLRPPAGSACLPQRVGACSP